MLIMIISVMILNAENPFTDPVDRASAEFVVGGGNTDSYENCYGYEPDGLDYEDRFIYRYR